MAPPLAYYRNGPLSWGDFLKGTAIQLVGQHLIVKNALSEVDRQTGRIMDGLSCINDNIEYGLSMISAELEALNIIQNKILETLQEISGTLKSPLITQAKEHLAMGLDRLEKGWSDKALESFLKALELNDVDFLTQYFVGKIYLYDEKINKTPDVLKKACDHLLLAMKYGLGDPNVMAGQSWLMAQVCFDLSVSYYVAGTEYSRIMSGAPDSTLISLYDTALRSIEQSFSIRPFEPLFTYQKAKYCLALGREKDSLWNLIQSLKMDPRFLAKSLKDPEFSQLTSPGSDYHSAVITFLKEAGIKLGKLREEFVYLTPEQKKFENEITALENSIQNIPVGDLDRISILANQVAVALDWFRVPSKK